MPRMSALEGVGVTGNREKPLGRVVDVLFHPSEPRAVAVVVERPRTAGVVARPPVYVPLGMLGRTDEGFTLEANALPGAKAGEQFLGYSWDETVHWDGMPVRSDAGDLIGAVDDVTFAFEGGDVSVLKVSTGILGDIAVGRLEVPGELVSGFDGEAVVVSAAYTELEASGGAAKAAAKGAAVAKETGARVAKQAYDAGMSAAIAVGKSFKSGTGRRMLDKLKELTREDEE